MTKKYSIKIFVILLFLQSFAFGDCPAPDLNFEKHIGLIKKFQIIEKWNIDDYNYTTDNFKNETIPYGIKVKVEENAFLITSDKRQRVKSRNDY